MTRPTPLLALTLMVSLLACTKPEPVIYRVSLGMTEEKLIEAVGPPLSITEQADGKTLEYRSWASDLHARPVYQEDWYVHIAHGKVDAFGRHRKQPVKHTPEVTKGFS